MTIGWDGKGLQERGIDVATGKTRVTIDELYFRPTEVEELLGDPTKARERLGWKHEVTFTELVAEMVSADRQARSIEVP